MAYVDRTVNVSFVMGDAWSSTSRKFTKSFFLLAMSTSATSNILRLLLLSSNIDIDQHWLPHTLDLWNHTLQIESLGENDLENLLHVYRSRGGAEDQWGMHCSGETFCLKRHLLKLGGEVRNMTQQTCFVISSCSSRGKVAKVSNFVPIRNGIAVWTFSNVSLMSKRKLLEME